MSGFFEQAKSKVCLFEGTHAAMRPLISTWEQRKLGELAHSFEYGLNAAAKPYDGVTKYLRITDIDDDTREFSQNDLTSPDVSDNVAREYSLHDGDLLFARTGASVGKTYLYQRRDGRTAFAGFLIRAVPNDDCDPHFLFQSTLGKGYIKYIAVTSQRSGQPGVNAAEYADWSLMAPSFDEQRQIGALFVHLDSLITLHQREPPHTMKEGKNANRYQWRIAFLRLLFAMD